VVYRRSSGATHDPVCSFCGRKKSEGNRRFIAGPAGVYICEECVGLCVEVLEENARGPEHWTRVHAPLTISGLIPGLPVVRMAATRNRLPDCIRWLGGHAPGHGSIGQRLCDRSARGGRIRGRLLPSVSQRRNPRSGRGLGLAHPTDLDPRGRTVGTGWRPAEPVRWSGNRGRGRALGGRSSARMDTSRPGRRRCGLDPHMDWGLDKSGGSVRPI
jgi:hypothetical protein